MCRSFIFVNANIANAPVGIHLSIAFTDCSYHHNLKNEHLSLQVYPAP